MILGSAGGAAGGAEASRWSPIRPSSPRPTSPIIKPKLSSCAAITGLTDLAANPQLPDGDRLLHGHHGGQRQSRVLRRQGMIAPQTHFDLQLPVNTWQGRYLQNGCGGYCGTVSGTDLPVL